MNRTRKVIVSCCLFLIVLAVCCGHFFMNYIWEANLTFEGMSGGKIFLAIEKSKVDQVNWPSDSAKKLDFTNSTDYFSSLLDENNLGTSNWSPLVVGIDRKYMAWRGTHMGSSGARLKPKENMWTVIKNVSDETPAFIPVLITRNVKASSLRTKLSPTEMNKRLSFEETSVSPLGKNFVAIRKDGSMFKATKKIIRYGVVYRDTAFDETTNNRPKIKYLTPLHEVTPDNN